MLLDSRPRSRFGARLQSAWSVLPGGNESRESLIDDRP